MSHADARALRDALDDSLSRRQQFLRTVGEHRPDGSYVVERASAESSGHRKVFDRFADLRAVFEGLPTEFTAADVSDAVDDLSGNRRHLLVRHLAEHPAFDCALTSRQPLTARKTTETASATARTDRVEDGDTMGVTTDD